MKENDMQIC